MVFNYTGQIVLAEGGLMLLPMIVSLIYAEWRNALSFLITILIAVIIGLLLLITCKPKSRTIYAKEGFVIVALCWVVLSAVGALPFTISGEISNYCDAFFETVSGFTTTGASILRNVEALGYGMLFWRSFTHWIGGMGILVFIVALIPSMCDRSIHVLRAEMPGPIIGKLVPKTKETARILYLIYVVLTIVLILLLMLGGMPLFESCLYAFATAGTGGFSCSSAGVAEYSPYIQWVITIFMLLFGVNFNIFYLLLFKKFKAAFSSTEFWTYLGIFCGASLLITGNIIFSKMADTGSIGDIVRDACFQVASVMTTTGYATTDYNLWPSFSKAILIILMFIGACAGSTGGGLKISRVVMLCKMIARELRKMLHPRSVSTVQFEGKRLDDTTLSGTANYFALYILLFVCIFFFISLEPFSFESNFTAVVACINNIGPGLGAVGPSGSFADYSIFSKLILSFAMLVGRLEIYPMLFVLAPSVWRKRSN